MDEFTLTFGEELDSIMVSNKEIVIIKEYLYRMLQQKKRWNRYRG